MQAHQSSGVVVDIAAFKVSHSVDKDATALRAARARSASIGAWMKKVQKCEHSQTATPKSRACAQQPVSSRGRWRNCLGRFEKQALTPCQAKFMSTRAAAGQFKGQFKGQWRNGLGRFNMQTLTHWNANITSMRTAVGQFKGQFKGAMDESSGKV